MKHSVNKCNYLLISLQIWFTVHICRHEVNIFHIDLRFLCQLILVDMLGVLICETTLKFNY